MPKKQKKISRVVRLPVSTIEAVQQTAQRLTGKELTLDESMTVLTTALSSDAEQRMLQLLQAKTAAGTIASTMKMLKDMAGVETELVTEGNRWWLRPVQPTVLESPPLEGDPVLVRQELRKLNIEVGRIEPAH